MSDETKSDGAKKPAKPKKAPTPFSVIHAKMDELGKEAQVDFKLARDVNEGIRIDVREEGIMRTLREGLKRDEAVEYLAGYEEGLKRGLDLTTGGTYEGPSEPE